MLISLHIERMKQTGKGSDRRPLDPLVAAIVQKRREQKLTQETVANAAGISRRALCMIEGGGDVTLSTLRRLYTAMDIEIQVKPHRRPTLEDMDAQNSRELFGHARVEGL